MLIVEMANLVLIKNCSLFNNKVHIYSLNRFKYPAFDVYFKWKSIQEFWVKGYKELFVKTFYHRAEIIFMSNRTIVK